jgi:uncharacterized protein
MHKRVRYDNPAENMDMKIEIPRAALSDYCRRKHIRRLAFFGSVQRDDFGPGSDIDILVEFEPGEKVGLRFFEMEIELSSLLGRKVDLNTPGFLSPYFRDDVLREAETAYAS